MKPVVMYATHSCKFFQPALRWLNKHPQEAAFVEVRFVDVDAAAQDDFRGLGFRGVPAFVTESNRWSGWDPDQFVQELRKQRTAP